MGKKAKTREREYKLAAHSLLAVEAMGGVVVDDADGLHPGVDDDGADEFAAGNEFSAWD
jgi:hypothetical protein